MSAREGERLDPAGIAARLGPHSSLGPVIVRPRLQSTNTALLRGARSGRYRAGTVLAAEDQTAGKVRLHRGWISVPRRSLAFSILLCNPAPEHPGFLSVATALAVAEGIEEAAPAPLAAAIKWPNDVYLGAAKVAGVLLEALSLAAGPHVVAGIGVNVNAEPPDLQEGLRAPATSVRAAAGRTADRSLLLAAILRRLEALFARLATGGGAEIAEGLRRRSLLVGRVVRCRRSRRLFEGRLVGHTDDLGLILRTATGEVTLPGAGTDLLCFEGAESRRGLS